VSRTVARITNYQRRIVDDELDALVVGLPALSIDGAKGVGKTATAMERAATVFALDEAETLAVIEADPQRLTTAPEPTLIDEWHRYPPSWDLVRRAVDARGEPARFLLTGSASPQTPAAHSGAGRIVRVRMRPLTLPERGLPAPTVSLAALLTGTLDGRRVEISGSTQVNLQTYGEHIVAGGFPGMSTSTGRAQRARLRSYIDLVVGRDFPEAGLAVRNPALLRRWMTAYAAATATTASYESLRDAASAGAGNKPAKSTTIPYQDTLQRIWVSDPVAAWSPSHNHMKRLTLAPKHHLADPALAVSLTGLSLDDLLLGRAPGAAIPRDGTFLGALFESLVALNLRVFAQGAEARVYHLRTKSGEREIDFIITGPDGKVVAVDVKLAQVVGAGDVRHLKWLADALGPDLLDAVVVTTGAEAYRRADGIAVVPLALLGP
jgi:predicted AAA+ superfamily ATPase